MFRVKFDNFLDIKFLLFLKPIFDVFWQIKILNYFLVLYIILIFFKEYRDFKIKINFMNIISLLGILIIINSFFNEVSYSNTILLLKLLSTFILYYVAQKIKNYSTKSLLNYMLWGYLIAFITSCLALLLNTGFIYWGDSFTFVGFYYFKTDLGVSLLWLIFLILISEKWILKRKLISFIFILLSYYMILLSNSRVSLILSILLPILAYNYHKEKKNGRFLKINLFTSFILLLTIFLGVYLIRYLSSSYFFTSNSFIAFNFYDISDLYTGANLQGRNYIWDNLIYEFYSQSPLKHFFGVRINSTVIDNSFIKGLSAHSIYIGIIFSYGYIGMLLFIIYIISIVIKLNKEIDRIKFYLSLLSIIFLLVYGISVNTHEFTNFSWNVAFMSGLLLNSNKIYFKKSKEIL